MQIRLRLPKWRALENDEITFKQLWESQEEEALELQGEVKKQCLENIGYFVEPQYLFTSIIDRINRTPTP